MQLMAEFMYIRLTLLDHIILTTNKNGEALLCIHIIYDVHGNPAQMVAMPQFLHNKTISHIL